MNLRSLPHPFIKWVGGKTKMLGRITTNLPVFGDYYEPFLGGGAVFFDLVRRNKIKQAYLGDMNPELINTYNVIKSEVSSLIEELTSGKYIYDKDCYLKIRSIDNKLLNEIERAARFIYLNRTCFNGLYRVNKDGCFNVPFGKYNNPLICDEENLQAVSKALSFAKITNCDFSNLVSKAKIGDFVYFDPPYHPISKTSNFVSYTKDGFDIEKQELLAKEYKKLADKGVIVIASNSYCPEILNLYRDFQIIEITASRNVGGSSKYRKPVREVMIFANIPEENNHG